MLLYGNSATMFGMWHRCFCNTCFTRLIGICLLGVCNFLRAGCSPES